MTKDIIRTKVIKIIENDILMRKVSELDDNESLSEGKLGINSLNFLKFFTCLEKEFGIEIKDEYWNYKKMNTLNHIVDYLYSNQQEDID